MLSIRHNQSGTTLIELLVGLVVFAILVGTAVPAARNWMQSAQIRNAAEAVQNGLQVAVANAVSLNDQVQFRLLAGDSTWIVGCATPSARCPAAIQSHSGVQATRNAVITPVAAITFNGFGRLTPNPGVPVTFLVQNTTGGTCVDAGGPMRCLKVVVTPGGEIRTCDPALTLNNPLDPQAC